VGQKVSAYALRLGINQAWKSHYFPPKKGQANWLQQDKLIRDYLFSRFPGINQIKIERTETELIIFVHSPNTSLITGESNDNSDAVLAKISQIVNDQKIVTKLRLVTERDTAQAIANDLARQLEDRVDYRLALRNLLFKLRQEVWGFMIVINGLIGGVEIAQSKKTKQGQMPFGTLVCLIEHGWAEANTDRGQVGITVFIYKGKREKINYGNSNT